MDSYYIDMVVSLGSGSIEVDEVNREFEDEKKG